MKNTMFERVFDITQLSIDCLEPRNRCAKYKQYYNNAHNSSAKHIVGCDWYAKSKVLTTHNLKPSAYREALTNYTILGGDIYTLDKLIKMLKHKHTKYIIYSKHEIVKNKEKLVNYIAIDNIGIYRVYYTTRTHIQKILDNQE